MHLFFSEMWLCCRGETLTKFLTSSPTEMLEESRSRGMTELLSTALVTHQKQKWSRHRFPSPPSSDLSLCSVWISMLALDLANLSKSFYSNCQLDKRSRKLHFFPPSERGKTEKNDRSDQKGGRRKKTHQKNTFLGEFLRSKRSSDKESCFLVSQNSVPGF